MEGKSIAIIDIASSSKMKILPQTEDGECQHALFIQTLFTSTIFTLVMEMALEATTLTIMMIPLSHQPSSHIRREPPNIRRNRYTNGVWCVSKKV